MWVLLSSEASGSCWTCHPGEAGGRWGPRGLSLDTSPIRGCTRRRGLKEKPIPGQLPPWPWCSAALWILPVPEILGA